MGCLIHNILSNTPNMASWLQSPFVHLNSEVSPIIMSYKQTCSIIPETSSLAATLWSLVWLKVFWLAPLPCAVKTLQNITITHPSSYYRVYNVFFPWGIFFSLCFDFCRLTTLVYLLTWTSVYAIVINSQVFYYRHAFSILQTLSNRSYDWLQF